MERKLRITVNGTAYDVTVEDLSETDTRIIPGPADMRVPAQPPPQAPPASALAREPAGHYVPTRRLHPASSRIRKGLPFPICLK